MYSDPTRQAISNDALCREFESFLLTEPLKPESIRNYLSRLVSAAQVFSEYIPNNDSTFSRVNPVRNLLTANADDLRIVLRILTPSSSSDLSPLVALKRFFSWAKETGKVTADPTIELRSSKTIDKALFLSTGQIDALLAQPDPTTLIGARDHALLLAFYLTAIRPCEIHAAKIADWSSIVRLLSVGPPAKRLVQFPVEAADALDHYLRLRAQAGPTSTASWLFSTDSGKPLDNYLLMQIGSIYAQSAGCIDSMGGQPISSLRDSGIAHRVLLYNSNVKAEMDRLGVKPKARGFIDRWTQRLAVMSPQDLNTEPVKV